ncbi:MAG TPA: methyl-accepting chemotaxis protein, partial [Ruminiclostridium sp.]|nr:methyl-accepting chemotaxis protein [Ruminiclostridium sp.]
MKIKTQLVLSFTAILLLFSITIFLIIYFSVSGIITLNYENSIESSSKLSLAFLDERFPGNWNVKDNILYKGNEK